MSAPHPVEVLKALAEARALLWQAGELSITEGIEGLLHWAERHNITERIPNAAIVSIVEAPFQALAEE